MARQLFGGGSGSQAEELERIRAAIAARMAGSEAPQASPGLLSTLTGASPRQTVNPAIAMPQTTEQTAPAGLLSALVGPAVGAAQGLRRILGGAAQPGAGPSLPPAAVEQEQLPSWNPALSNLPPNVTRNTQSFRTIPNPAAATYREQRLPPIQVIPKYDRKGRFIGVEKYGTLMTGPGRPSDTIRVSSNVTDKMLQSLPYRMEEGDFAKQAELEFVGKYLNSGADPALLQGAVRGFKKATSGLFNQGQAGMDPVRDEAFAPTAEETFKNTPYGQLLDMDFQELETPRQQMDFIANRKPQPVDKLQQLALEESQTLLNATPQGKSALSEKLNSLSLGQNENMERAKKLFRTAVFGNVARLWDRRPASREMQRLEKRGDARSKKIVQLVNELKSGKLQKWQITEKRQEIERLRKEANSEKAQEKREAAVRRRLEISLDRR